MSSASPIKPWSTKLTTQVRMHLEVGGEQVPVNQLGLDFAIVEVTANHPPGPAKLFVKVDDDLTIRSVFLPNGIHPSVVRTKLALG